MKVWLILFLTVILMGPIMHIFINYLQPLARPRGERDVLLSSLGECYWFVYGAVLRQGSNAIPNSSECVGEEGGGKEMA